MATVKTIKHVAKQKKEENQTYVWSTEVLGNKSFWKYRLATSII